MACRSIMPDSATVPSPHSQTSALRSSAAPRWLVILVWSPGVAGVYALVGLLHAALVERLLTLDIGFGRSLAFWVVALYVALPLWGFLPKHPTGWYARKPAILVAGVFAVLGTLVCGGYTLVWVVARWNATVGVPVLASILLVAVVAVATLWWASREEEPRGESGPTIM
jgi:hypothetical protein